MRLSVTPSKFYSISNFISFQSQLLPTVKSNPYIQFPWPIKHDVFLSYPLSLFGRRNNQHPLLGKLDPFLPQQLQFSLLVDPTRRIFHLPFVPAYVSVAADYAVAGDFGRKRVTSTCAADGARGGV